MIKLEKALAHFSMSQDAFLDMCIAAGCDYLANVRGIGIHKAQKLVTECNDFLGTLQRNKHAPGEYTVGFQTAKAIFLHQTVINPADVSATPLSPWGEAPDSEDILTSCGMYPILISYSRYCICLSPPPQKKKNHFQQLMLLTFSHES